MATSLEEEIEKKKNQVETPPTRRGDTWIFCESRPRRFLERAAKLSCLRETPRYGRRQILISAKPHPYARPTSARDF